MKRNIFVQKRNICSAITSTGLLAGRLTSASKEMSTSQILVKGNFDSDRKIIDIDARVFCVRLCSNCNYIE